MVLFCVDVDFDVEEFFVCEWEWVVVLVIYWICVVLFDVEVVVV